ncbi:MAG: peptidoglycan DD-metalloendopeptidase family protein [Caloramator sp.]|nr:peptidoglycan DD-metalloendopeptidase family protein [Caloramator sp.]
MYSQNYYNNIRNRNKKSSDFLTKLINNLSIVLIILVFFIVLKAVKTTTALRMNEGIKNAFYKDYTQQIKSFAINKLGSLNFGSIKVFKQQEFIIDQVPIEGKIILKFGDKIDENNISKGIIYETDTSKDVKAIFDGIVEKIEANDEYGLLITIDHKNGYKSIFGYLDEIRLTEGETVKKGAIIGVNGVIPKTKKYALYFELQYNNSSVDPLKYIKQY